MELAGRVFDSVVHASADDAAVRDAFPELKNNNTLSYWRRVLRMAALTHDIGHLPFSHAAETELLPEGWSHERLTAELLRNSSITKVLQELRPKVDIDNRQACFGSKEGRRHRPHSHSLGDISL